MIIDFYNKKTPKNCMMWCDVCRCLTQLLIGSRCYHYFTSAKVFFLVILIRWWLLCKCRPTGNVSNDVPVELRWWLVHRNHIFFIQRLYSLWWASGQIFQFKFSIRIYSRHIYNYFPLSLSLYMYDRTFDMFHRS